MSLTDLSHCPMHYMIIIIYHYLKIILCCYCIVKICLIIRQVLYNPIVSSHALVSYIADFFIIIISLENMRHYVCIKCASHSQSRNE